jgi:RNA recognition motif-containing protein
MEVKGTQLQSGGTKRKREEPRGPSHSIFNPQKQSGGMGTFHGKGFTKTAQNNTLFVTNIPSNVKMAQVSDLFKASDGFLRVRPVHHLAFVDFDTIAHANAAMRRFQDHKFPGAQQGLQIDYDKATLRA